MKATDEKTYSIAENGAERGEFTLEEIIAMAQTGQIEVGSSVYLNAHNQWVPLAKIVSTRLAAMDAGRKAEAVKHASPAAAAAVRVQSVPATGYTEPAGVVFLRIFAFVQLGAALLCLIFWRLDAMALWLTGFTSAVLWLCIAQALGLLAKIEYNTRK